MIFTVCFVITAIAAAAQATSEFPSIAATAVRTITGLLLIRTRTHQEMR